MDYVSHVKEMGVVGAGGAGFPTHVKLGTNAHTVLVNAAECEPLLHKDKQILKHFPDLFFKGLGTVMTAVQADQGIIGIKKKHTTLISRLQSCLPEKVKICEVDDFYPAGDEITLIRETTGMIIDPGQLPISGGIVVNNVESLYNIGRGRPVVDKFINIAGNVNHLQTLCVPIGISFQELIDYAEPTFGKFTVIEGGPMMGRIVEDLSDVVTKTTAALIVLPDDHVLVKKYTDMASPQTVDRIGKSACDQCTFCTELCPRYLLGHPIQPHKAMRALIFHQPGDDTADPPAHTLYCCQCNLCSFVSCPEGLYPSRVCINHRRTALERKVSYDGPLKGEFHPLAQYRKTPSRRLKTMLDLNKFSDSGELSEFRMTPKILTIKLRQHIGGVASALVKEGDQVIQEQKIATMGDELGSEIFSPANGKILRITLDDIRIEVETK